MSSIWISTLCICIILSIKKYQPLNIWWREYICKCVRIYHEKMFRKRITFPILVHLFSKVWFHPFNSYPEFVFVSFWYWNSNSNTLPIKNSIYKVCKHAMIIEYIFIKHNNGNRNKMFFHITATLHFNCTL